MDETTRMTVIDETGEEREVRLLFTFETPDKRQFALFTSADDQDGDVYPYQYDEDGNMDFVTDEKDREMCEEMLGTYEDIEGLENAG